METTGSILLICGVAGLVAYLALAPLKPRMLPQPISVAVIVSLLVITCAGLILLTIATGGRSLHTGG